MIFEPLFQCIGPPSILPALSIPFSFLEYGKISIKVKKSLEIFDAVFACPSQFEIVGICYSIAVYHRELILRFGIGSILLLLSLANVGV